ncbi:hypothetical protein SERLADRAFT_471794 [Serpula lacrymans var. lacrymans S7.9]|nr:uncharacterized protein SERLADRAFT_471794 [Serpula lacrymans var. lacrymans S7.9]EGO23088.1 hypothetical protein SERLADRAFT_471794 [Serpula lacrymans var. lacrymans S7.9]
MEEEQEDSLEELEEGLDVLMILERAYESTIKAHVVREPKTNDTRPIPSTATSHLSSQISSSSPSSPSVTMFQQQSHIPSSGSSNVPPSSPPVSHPLQNSPEFIPLMAGSSTALLAVLEHAPHKPQRSSSPHPAADIPVGITTHDAVLKIAHLGDCMGMLVRDEEVVWRSEEMWWSFNTPVQLGPSSSARPKDAQILTLPVQADDILILASDGLSDNLWDEEVLDEVVRFKRSFLSSKSGARKQQDVVNMSQGLLGRRSLAGMLSEALCSRARRVSERRGTSCGSPSSFDDEVPFARRAREQGRSFRGGKIDDISVLVAVISPAADAPMSKS